MEATHIQKEPYAAVTLKAKVYFLGTEMHPNNQQNIGHSKRLRSSFMGMSFIFDIKVKEGYLSQIYDFELEYFKSSHFQI